VSTACGDVNETTVVTETPVPPTPPTPPSPPVRPTPPTQPSGLLPFTGADAVRALLAAFGLVAVGSGLVGWRRRILARR